MNNRKKVIYAVIICMMINNTYVFAEKSDSIKEEIENNKNKIESLEDEKEKVNSSIEEEKNQLSGVEEQIKEKENELYKLQKEISEYQKQIDEIQSEVNKLNNAINESKNTVEIKKKYIEELKEEQKRIQELLDSRVRSVYKVNLAQQYIYMIIKSKNIFEVFQNLTSISRIIDFDKDLIKKSKVNQENMAAEIEEINLKIQEQEENQIAIKEKQAEIVSAKNSVVAIQDKEEEKKQELLALQNDKLNSIASLENNNVAINNQINDLESHNSELEAELDRIINNVAGGTGNDDKLDDLPIENGFLRPIPGQITSYYGYRVNPVTGEYKLHKGIDYAGNYGDPIKASKSGVVEYSGWISGYGKTIILGHGNGVQTLYPHAQTLKVSVGDTVSQGDVIAEVGSTGNSTGPHLHFEIRINGEAVDPLNYIPY
ncbi:peptidoglycan DD-metalloendopeptidase family protein [Clostridium sp. D53t1_180928_C8]|uniref:murein hydrolase activator EnvC family protein n=1 Tax=Clostridium sp. D53t1_180928_C8 TaxID=2787101 RepID=UPI0024357660|nr:peptidoglycan DD-metalloendopeptidase family protein [Clostridium sp. D53t1_180928_C8]